MSANNHLPVVTRFTFPLLLLAGIVQAQSGDFVSTVLSTMPVGYWRLDTAGEPSLVNGYSVTEVGNASYTLAGGGAPITAYPNNAALSLSGNNTTPAYVKTGLSGGVPGQGSIMAWVKLAQLPSVGGAYQYVAGESQDGNDLDLQFQNDNKIYFYTGSGENTNYLPDTTKLANTWHLIVATYVGGAQGSRNIYWDGALAATTSGGVSAGTKTTPFSIGYSLVFGGRDFDGLIDEVAVWNRALTAAEVASIYSSTSNPLSTTVITAIPSFLGKSGFSPNSYAEIYGMNFTDHSRTWTQSDFNGSDAPTSLDDVSVMVDGKPAFVYYISPTQININLPQDSTTGPVQLQVTSSNGVSNAATITLAPVSPALLTTQQFLIGQTQYVVAFTPDFSSFIGNPNMVAGSSFVLAKPGDTVIIYALGCGPTTPATQAGVVVPQLSPLALPYQVTVGGVAAKVNFAGIIPGAIGLYQINVVIPAVSAGDQPIQLTVDGVANAQNLFISVGQ